MRAKNRSLYMFGDRYPLQEIKAWLARASIRTAIKFHANYDHAKHLSSQSAHVLMKGMSEKKITGTEGGGFRTIASLLYEAISGLPDTDLKRSCDSVLRNARGPN